MRYPEKSGVSTVIIWSETSNFRLTEVLTTVDFKSDFDFFGPAIFAISISDSLKKIPLGAICLKIG